MHALRTQMRTLSRASARVPTRSTARTGFRRNYATEEGPPEGPPGGKKAGGFPVAAITAAVSIPALAWFFMGRSPQTTEQKGAVMKDARSEGAPTKGPGPASDTGTVNEEPSRSVPAEAPDSKGKKMANPKAVSGDNERLGTERAEKTNTLTGTDKK